MNPIAVRLLNQQLVAPQYSDPAEVVSYMGAMQAQEYRMMRWAGIDPFSDDDPMMVYQKILKGKIDRKSTRLNSSHSGQSRMPSSA